MDKKSLQEAIVDYAVKNCFETFVRRSEPTRLLVGCKVKSCRFRINGTVVSRTSTFKVKKFETEHTCGLKYTHTPGNKATSSFDATKIVERYGKVLFVSIIMHSIDP